MYFLTHLMAGILIGIIITFIFPYTRVILACAIGSIVPDIIDKPAGILFLYKTGGYGRIYCHTLLFVVLFIVFGLVLYFHYKKNMGIKIIALVMGILSHQLLDHMWLEPVTWFWPAFGEFNGHSRPDFFWNALCSEIMNPIEWITGSMILAIIFIYFIPKYNTF